MKRSALGDEMLYCDRCGVSFLWTAEEQRQAVAADGRRPSHCPGCRRLLAPPGRERGVVKWYNERKKYGFITRTSGPELFAHRSGFDGVGRLRPGDLVEFAVETGEKGAMAVEVRVLDQALESLTIPLR